jgi:hypothetical protein
MVELAMLSVIGQGMILAAAGIAANERRFAPVAALRAPLIPIGTLGAVLALVLLSSPLGGLASLLGLALLFSSGLAIYTGACGRWFAALLTISALGLLLAPMGAFLG